MSEPNVEVEKLGSDLALFIAELAKLEALPPCQAVDAARACEEQFSDLAGRIRDAIVYCHCVFVERKHANHWQYLLQHGDFMVCDNVPGSLRDSIVKPILHDLTPLGLPNEVIWYCLS